MTKRPTAGFLRALEIKDELLAAVRDAVDEGEDGITLNEAAELFGLSYHNVSSAVQELANIGEVVIASRANRNICRIALPGWEPPAKLDLTAKQQSSLEHLLSVADVNGLAYTSYKDIAISGTVAVGGIVGCLVSLDRKGYISLLLRGKGARRTLFRVYPDGNGPKGYSPMAPMVPVPDHLGIPCPPHFSRWARGKSVQDGVAFYKRCAPVIRRWFCEAGIEPERRSPEQAPPSMSYPFIVRDRGTPEQNLLKRVNAAVPAYLPPDRRADICQDLMVGILCGEIDEARLELSAKEFTKRVLRQHPTQFGDLSLDAKLGDTDLTLMDRLSDDMNPWEMMEAM